VNPNSLSAVASSLKNTAPTTLPPQLVWNAELLSFFPGRRQARFLMLHVELSADYPGRKDILHNLTFDMSEGEVVGLVGTERLG